jgi:hypothetical protein
MTIRKYGVLDAEGFKVNTILIDDTTLDGYYPGYGAKLIDEGLPAPEPEKYVAPPKPVDFGVFDVDLAEPMRVGDKIDFKTGEVTKKPPEPVEPTDEEEIVKP